jgi:polyadenylate-binding protein
MRYDDLAALSIPVRKEVLTGELSRRVRELSIVPNDELDAVVSSLVGLSLGDVVEGIQDNTKLTEQVKNARDSLQAKSSNSKSPSPSASQDSALLDPNSLAAASAPEHPSTPISNGSLSSPPRTASPSGSVPPLSERDRMIAAVSRLESSRQAELTDLLMSLSKRERAMCLFNAEILRAKLADAKNILDLEEDEPEPAKTTASPAPAPAPAAAKPSKPAAEPPVTPQTKRTQPMTESPQTPDLSSRGPSATASPMPTTPAAPTGHTVQSLARLPAAEIVRLATSPSATGLPLAKADPLVVKATDEFIDGLLDKPIQQQKQLLGDKLWVSCFVLSRLCLWIFFADGVLSSRLASRELYVHYYILQNQAY